MSVSKVYIASTNMDEPVYHSQTIKEMKGPYGKVHRAVTTCGKTVTFAGNTLHLPRAWADKFATACQECYE